jgi:hypothetical protein
MKNLQWGNGCTTPKVATTRPPDKATRTAKVLHHRVQHDRSKASSAAREKHLRSLMGLPATPSTSDDERCR